MSNRTRREWLRVVGTAGVVGVAGCSSSEETEPDEGEAETDEEEAEPPLQNPTQQAKLIPGGGDGNDRFGGSVALSSDGSTALVSAPFDADPNGEDAGSAYVFV